MHGIEGSGGRAAAALGLGLGHVDDAGLGDLGRGGGVGALAGHVQHVVGWHHGVAGVAGGGSFAAAAAEGVAQVAEVCVC